MIFGKTKAQKEQEEQDKIISLVAGVKRFRIFAKLADGRFVFFQHVYEYCDCWRDGLGKYYLFYASKDSSSPLVRSYLEPSGNHIRLRKEK